MHLVRISEHAEFSHSPHKSQLMPVA